MIAETLGVVQETLCTICSKLTVAIELCIVMSGVDLVVKLMELEHES